MQIKKIPENIQIKSCISVSQDLSRNFNKLQIVNFCCKKQQPLTINLNYQFCNYCLKFF